MKEKRTIVKKLSNLPKGKTNWRQVRSLTDNELEKLAQSDPDALPVTRAALKKFKRVDPVKKVNVKKIREKILHLTQSEFATYFGISLRTLQQWEQGRSEPSGVARNFLKVIEKEPEAVQRALKRY